MQCTEKYMQYKEEIHAMYREMHAKESGNMYEQVEIRVIKTYFHCHAIAYITAAHSTANLPSTIKLNLFKLYLCLSGQQKEDV